MQVATGWKDYELVDTGEGMKLERWGQYTVARPDPRIIWSKGNPSLWAKADAAFANDKWNFTTPPPPNWIIAYKQIKFKLRPTDFKHTGVFPVQAVNWDWLRQAKK